MISPRRSDFDTPKIVADPRSEFTRISDTWRCWVWTTTGIVLMLLLVQFITGLLLAFYYVPSADHAHTTVSFIEKALPAGTFCNVKVTTAAPYFLRGDLVEVTARHRHRNRIPVASR